MMSPETTVSLSFILALISAAGVIFTIVMNLKKDHREDEDRRIEIAEQFAKINVKLDQFCNTMNELARKSEKSMDEVKSVNVLLAKCNERIETLFKYHADHENRIKHLEDESK